MKRTLLPIDALAAWASLSGVETDGVAVRKLAAAKPIADARDGGAGHGKYTDRGSGMVATERLVGGDDELGVEGGGGDSKEEEEEGKEGAGCELRLRRLVMVPRDLVLSRERVEECAKVDGWLDEVLRAVGEFGKTARGAILIFLLLNITYADPVVIAATKPSPTIGVPSPVTEYLKFLPATYTLPTFFSVEERELLVGTSLEPALRAKEATLEREFGLLRAATAGIGWCGRLWWGDGDGEGEEQGAHGREASTSGNKTRERPLLTLRDWKLVDAMYRSRGLDLPGAGYAMVPYIDMANHAGGARTGALYEGDAAGNALLLLRPGQEIEEGEEVTITYGDEKGASEMIFSYGFLEHDMADARQLFLDLDIPDDDPLKPAKKAVCGEAPGLRLFRTEDGGADWESAFVWWACVNEEDGLDFGVVQSVDGQRELKVFWKGSEIGGMSAVQLQQQQQSLTDLLRADRQWPVFELRATVMIAARLDEQAAQLRDSEAYVGRWREYVDVGVGGQDEDVAIRPAVWRMAMRLRQLELALIEDGLRSVEQKKLQQLGEHVVQDYLGMTQPADSEEDFS